MNRNASGACATMRHLHMLDHRSGDEGRHDDRDGQQRDLRGGSQGAPIHLWRVNDRGPLTLDACRRKPTTPLPVSLAGAEGVPDRATILLCLGSVRPAIGARLRDADGFVTTSEREGIAMPSASGVRFSISLCTGGDGRDTPIQYEIRDPVLQQAPEPRRRRARQRQQRPGDPLSLTYFPSSLSLGGRLGEARWC